MAKLTADALIGMLKQSGLVEADQLDAAIARWKTDDIDVKNPRTIAVQAVKEELITRWQAEKLLQGKHRGFFLGKYRLLTLLGTGGMSSVYLAEHTLMRRQVAIKVLPQARVNDASYLERFHREAQAVASLDHPNIVRAYDVNQEGNVHFLVMEYVAGQSLHDLVTKNRPLGFVQAVEYVRQIAAGLEHAHNAGLIHRDIKPANLLVDERGVIKMLDLGLARFFHADDERPLTLKYDEKVLGTADYLSPEQALDSHKVDTRADIYSLGCTMYFLLTGHPPFPDGTLAQRLMYHQMKEPASLSTERPDTPPQIVAIVEKMMRKNPDERFQSVRDVAAVCTRWLKQNGGETWQTMKAAALDSSISKSTRTPPTQRKLATPPSQSARSDAPTAPPKPHTPPEAEPEQEPVHDAAMADFLAAMSGDEPEASTVIAEFPSAPFPTAPASSGPSLRQPVEKQEKQTSSSATVPSFDQAEESEELPADAFDFSRETTAPVSSTTNVIKSDQAGSPSSVLGESKVSQSISAISHLGTSSLSLMRKRPQLAIAISATTLLIGAAIIYMGIQPGTPGQANAPHEPTPAATSGGGGIAPPVVTGPLVVEKTIGPQGDFQTLSDALKYAAKNPPSNHPSAHILFSVQPGLTFNERIVIDNSKEGSSKTPPGIHFVVKDGTATLKPGGTEPVIAIIGGTSNQTDVNFLHLDGFQIDAAGADTAVQLSGTLPRCEIRRCTITNYAKVGVRGDAPRSFLNDDIVLADVTFRPATAASVAVQLARSKDQPDDPSNIHFSNCRFLGPMRTGIEFAAPVRNIAVEQCIFDRAETGIDVNYSTSTASRLQVANNSFHDCRIGLQFRDLQQIAYGGCSIAANAFIHCSEAAVRFQQGYNVGAFLGKGATDGTNWSDRPLGENDADVFRQGDTDAEFKFQSTDPSASDFLIPAGSGRLAKIGYTGENAPAVSNGQ